MKKNTINNLDAHLINLTNTAQDNPRKLPHLVGKLYEKKEEEEEKLNRLMPFVLSSLIKNNSLKTINEVMPALVKLVSDFSGVQTAFNLLSQLEIMFRWRKPRIGLYDHTLHLIGGGQKYGCTLANALQKDFDITLIVNKEVTLEDLKNWYELDLMNCRIKVIPLPFFERKEFREIDPEAVNQRTENPFNCISLESGNYDIFINNSMLEKVYPLSPVSVLICHFPERRRSSYFYADKYTYIVYNSRYTAQWIKKKWKIDPTTHIYPPVDFISSGQAAEKENIILSVARFEVGGSKQQLEMVKVFAALSRDYPEIFKNWKFILAGGSIEDNPYLEKIKAYLSSRSVKNIELKTNISLNELKLLYQKARIFWHFCGLNQTEPALVEHFGMSIVEAMQNKCVPIVFDGGGQKEIVDHGKSGFRFSAVKEVKEKTVELIKNEKLLSEMSRAAYERGMLFSQDKFIARIKELFQHIIETHFPREL